MQYKYAPNPDSSSPIKAVYLQNGQVFWKHSANSWWYSVANEPPNLIDVVIAANQLCALDNQGFIHYYYPYFTGLGWNKDPNASIGVAISSNNAGYLSCTNQKGEVWHRYVPGNGSWYQDYGIPAGPFPTWNYTVQQGDWLLHIVRKEYNTWGDDAKTMAIAEQVKILNPGVANWNLLHPGDVLKMPPKFP